MEFKYEVVNKNLGDKSFNEYVTLGLFHSTNEATLFLDKHLRESYVINNLCVNVKEGWAHNEYCSSYIFYIYERCEVAGNIINGDILGVYQIRPYRSVKTIETDF